jgi:ABC-type transport system substrate-binding protein
VLYKEGERTRMTRSFLILAVIVVLLVSNQAALQFVEGTAVDRVGAPRLDEVYMRIFINPQDALTAYLSGDLDIYPRLTKWWYVEVLMAENQTLLPVESFSFSYFGINTRAFVPADAGQSDAGRSLAPLNWTSFRQGLVWATPAAEEREEAIYSSLNQGNTPIFSVVPPQWGVWHNPTFPQPSGNFTEAWRLMRDGGFSVNNSMLYQPNGVAVRDTIEVHVGFNTLAVIGNVIWGYVDRWNNFTDAYLGVTNCNFELIVTTHGDVSLRAFQYRNFDIYFGFWNWDRSPDYLYDLFHSSQEGASNPNSCGIQNQTLDGLLETLKFGLNLDAKLDAAYRAQKLLMTEFCPYVPMHSPRSVAAYSNRSVTHYLTGMVNQRGFGADNMWTWNLLHWSDMPTGGGVVCAIVDRDDAMASLHPGWTTTTGGQVLDRIFDPLIAPTPSLEDLPWTAGSWMVEPFEWAPLNIVKGVKVTFQLRTDINWHDGKPVTSADVEFAWEFMRSFPRLAHVWEHFVWAESVDPCTVVAYLNVTSQWILYDLAEVALMFPKHIYNHPCVQGLFAGASPVDAPLWNISYMDWQGYAPPLIPHMDAGLTALVGCGAFVFDYWNATSNTIHLVRNPDYWVDSPVEANVVLAHQRVGLNEEFRFRVELVNTGSTAAAYGLIATSLDAVNVTIDGNVVATIHGPISLGPFETSVFNGTFTHSFATKGLHEVGCRTYENGSLLDTYEFSIYVTVAEDFNLDYTVDVYDVVVASLAFGSHPGDLLWDARADVNQDSTVDIFDMVKIALRFGWT